jgi:uncharacterized protein YecT (DUF1311 family)
MVRLNRFLPCSAPTVPANRPGATTSPGSGMARIRIVLLTGFLAAFGSHAAHAIDCKSQDLSMLEMTECADQDAKRADTELNTVYAALRKTIDPASQERLRDTQRAWIAFRDKECVFRTGGGLNQEGDIWPMLVLRCTRDLTEARTRNLQDQLKCQSWDESCPSR